MCELHHCVRELHHLLSLSHGEWTSSARKFYLFGVCSNNPNFTFRILFTPLTNRLVMLQIYHHSHQLGECHLSTKLELFTYDKVTNGVFFSWVPRNLIKIENVWKMRWLRIVNKKRGKNLFFRLGWGRFLDNLIQWGSIWRKCHLSMGIIVSAYVQSANKHIRANRHTKTDLVSSNTKFLGLWRFIASEHNEQQ